uniref:Tubulin delta chain n=1 Tax=Leptobrachium leishanense TaxID=445787 RepID=A0A8C5PDE0_9ANUR
MDEEMKVATCDGTPTLPVRPGSPDSPLPGSARPLSCWELGASSSLIRSSRPACSEPLPWSLFAFPECRSVPSESLGARLCEEIRQTYPAGHILSVAVAPHQSGETPLQHYNSLLCLAWLQRFADGVLIFQNDDVMCQAAALTDKKSPAVSGTPTAVSLSAMNSHIASCLAGLLYPVYSLKTSSSVSVGPEPWELLRSLCPMSSLKFLHTAQVCQRGTAFWDRVTSSLVQTLPRASPEGRMHHSLSVLAAARCSQDDSFLVSRDSVLNKLKQAYRCVAWNPRPVHCWIDSQNIVDPTCHSLSLTVCANHSSAADLISRVSQRAQAMYTARAYLHWYQRYGCEDEDFELAFQTLDEVVEEYSRLGDP